MVVPVDLIRSTITPVVEVFSFIMLLMALGISTVRTVQQTIPLYKVQSFILAAVTFLVALTPAEDGELSHFSVILFLFVPILLAIYIEPLLAQATVPEDVSLRERIRRLLNRRARQAWTETRQRAIPTWLEQRPAPRGEVLSLAANLLFVVAAYYVAFGLAGQVSAWEALDLEQRIAQANSLAVSLSLLMLGLSTMTNKQDIISQIMGLLVMEHGLFLAAIKVTAVPSTATVFVICLFLYTIITLLILFFLLPDLHRASGSVDVEDQQQLKG